MIFRINLPAKFKEVLAAAESKSSENSPLKFLDYDVSLMLADQVRVSQEEEARKFHYNLYTYESVFKSTIPGYYYRDHNIICRALEGLAVWRDIWDEDLSGAGLKSARFRGRETLKRRILLYEQELIIMNNKA